MKEKKILRALTYTAVFNSIIALILTILQFGPPGLGPNGFTKNFIFSQCIGLLCCSFIVAGRSLRAPQSWAGRLLIDGGGMVTGILAGVFLGSVITGINPRFFAQEFAFLIKILVGSILFGSVIHYFFSIREKASVAETMAQEERIRRLTTEKQAIETSLRLLQAQIEPHFLFNTLSNVLSLLDGDSEKGKAMLSDLTHYLRASLATSRNENSRIGQELALIEDYLKIFKVRMGERLHFQIDVPDEIRDRPFAPMLIQPLVENAIKHGLEPKIDGGKITIKAVSRNGVLRLEVADTGLGLHSGSQPGMGLANVRERLQSLYGDEARFIMEENNPTGLKAIIEVPDAKSEGDHSG